MDETDNEINEAQKIQLQRIRLAGEWNSFDGDVIADCFEKNKHLWEALVYGRFEHGELIELSELADGFINADEIYVLVKPQNLAEFRNILFDLEIDEIGWCRENEKGEIVWEGVRGFKAEDFYKMFGGALRGQVLVRLWWD
jgi:hypothetical protein